MMKMYNRCSRISDNTEMELRDAVEYTVCDGHYWLSATDAATASTELDCKQR